jgi:hypothetical protein
MRTIETQATITEDGNLIVPVPRDLLPGPHRVVVVIDEAPAIPRPATDPEILLAQVRERLAAAPATRTLAEQLELDRQERDAALRGAA